MKKLLPITCGAMIALAASIYFTHRCMMDKVCKCMTKDNTQDTVPPQN